MSRQQRGLRSETMASWEARGDLLPWDCDTFPQQGFKAITVGDSRWCGGLPKGKGLRGPVDVLHVASGGATLGLLNA